MFQVVFSFELHGHALNNSAKFGMRYEMRKRHPECCTKEGYHWDHCLISRGDTCDRRLRMKWIDASAGTARTGDSGQIVDI